MLSSTFAAEIVRILERAGCKKAFGVSGGAVFPLWAALSSSDIDVYHCRHETGAVFAAMEYSLFTNTIAIVFVTCGPGITNAITGLQTARMDGAKIVFLSAVTSAKAAESGKFQETLGDQMHHYSGEDLHYPLGQVMIINTRSDLNSLVNSCEILRYDPTGNILGVFTERLIQEQEICPVFQLQQPSQILSKHTTKFTTAESQYAQERIATGKFVFLVGYGARHAGDELFKVAELLESSVMTTPRAKGIFPESHSLSLGSIGFANDGRAKKEISRLGSNYGIVILGSRLKEFSSLYIHTQWTDREIFCIDIDPRRTQQDLPRQALVIREDIAEFLKGVLKRIVRHITYDYTTQQGPSFTGQSMTPGNIHPAAVMSVIQDLAIDRHDALILADVGNSFAWTTHFLRFNKAGRYRLSTSLAAMGHAGCGAIGVAAADHMAVSIVGDGAMLMQNEVSTAVQYSLPVVWLVMNDAMYNMCGQAIEKLGYRGVDCSIPRVDFASLGKALGAIGVSVTSVQTMREGLHQALVSKKPTVIDIPIDASVVAPIHDRIETLKS